MNEKTRLEEDLEKVQYQGKHWGGVVLILLALLLFAGLYIVKLQKKLYDTHERIMALNLEVDTLRLERETLKIDAARCANLSAAPEEEEGAEESETPLESEEPQKSPVSGLPEIEQE